MCRLCSRPLLGSCGYLHRPVLFMTQHICLKEPSHFLTPAAHTGLAASGVFQQASTLPHHCSVCHHPLRFFCSPRVPRVPWSIHSFNHCAVSTYFVPDTIQDPGTRKTNEVPFLQEKLASCEGGKGKEVWGWVGVGRVKTGK